MIILAAGLGIANFTLLALLFRRLRGDLNRQLSNMRAERNSEWILRALQGALEEREQAAMAANGSRFEPARPLPARSKRHLTLYLGGGLAGVIATISQAARETWETHRGQVIAGMVGVTVAAGVAAGLFVHWWPNGFRKGPSSSAPTAAPTVTVTPSYTPSAPSESTQPGSPAASTPGQHRPGVGHVPLTHLSYASRSSSRTARPSPSADGSTAPTGARRRTGGGGAASAPPTGVPSPTSTRTPGDEAVCAVIAVAPLLGLRLCLPGGG